MTKQEIDTIRAIVRQELFAMADRIVNLHCSNCAAHNEHDRCDDNSVWKIAEAIRGDIE